MEGLNLNISQSDLSNVYEQVKNDAIPSSTQSNDDIALKSKASKIHNSAVNV